MIGRRGLIVVVLASLITGSAVGLVCGILFARSVFLGGGPWHRMAREAPRAEPPPIPLMMLRRRLDLTHEQTERVREELHRTREQFEAVRESLSARIERELTPEQRARWRAMRRNFPEPGTPRGPLPAPRPAEPGPEGE